MKFVKKSIFLFMCIVCIGITLMGTTRDVNAHDGKMFKGVYCLNLHYYAGYDDGKDENYDRFDKADVTDDGKKDIVETICTEKTCLLYVNGTLVKMWNRKKTHMDISDVGIITLANKKSFLFICEFQHKGRTATVSKGTTICRLYQVKNGKLVTKFDFEKMFDCKLLSGNDFIFYLGDYDEKDSDDSFLPNKVNKNTFYVDLFITTKSFGQMSVKNLKISYIKGKMQLVEGNYKARLAEWSWDDDEKIKYYSLAEKVQTVKSPGSSKKSAVLKKGTQFKLQKVSFKGKNIYAQVKTKNNKTYWIKLSTSNSSMVKKRSTIDYRG